jgi:hypothetical protein
MIRKIPIFLMLLASIFFASLSLAAEQAKPLPKLGVFCFPEPEMFKKADLKVTRKILKDFEIEELYKEIDAGKDAEEIKPLRILKEFKKAGVDIIVTLRWPANREAFSEGETVNGVDTPETLLDRVPKDADRERSLTLIKRFLGDFGPDIDVVSLQNECLGGPGRYSKSDMLRKPGERSPAGLWLEDVARTVRETISENPKLSHLKIASPVWQGVASVALQGIMIPKYHSNPKISLLGEIVDISNKYCDYVDLHFLHMPLERMDEFISFVKKHTDLTLITTEWAGLHGVRKWLNEPVSESILKKISEHSRKSGFKPKTNRDVVQFAQKKKVPVKDWNDFLKTMPHTEDFALKSYRIFEKHGFAYACWALGFQYSHVVYDLNTLFANMKTREKFAPNEPAYEDFQRVMEYAGGKRWSAPSAK